MPQRLTFLLLLALASGCSTTHPRSTAKFRTGTRKGYNVALMVPDMNVMWQSYGTNKFFSHRGLEMKSEARLAENLIEELKDLNYTVRKLKQIKKPRPAVLRADDPKPGAGDEAPKGKAPKKGEEPSAEDPQLRAVQTELSDFRKVLTTISDEIIAQDPAYNSSELGSHSVRKLPNLAALGAGKVKVDYILYVWGEVRLETAKATTWRILKTMTIAMLKGTTADVANAMLGGTLGSPEEVFVRVVLIDARNKKVVYHNDYFKQNWTLFMGSVWEDIASGLIDGMPER